MRRAAVLTLGLACGCGGGGTDAGPASSVPATQTVLESCLAPNVAEIEAILALFASLETSGSQAGFEITGFNLFTGEAAWRVDVDGDGTADLEGSARFTDAAGNPTIPFDPADLLGGADIAALLATVPDGTILIASYQVLTPPEGDGEIRVTFASGTFETFSGEGGFVVGPCAFDYAYADLRPGDLEGDYPTASFDLSIGYGADVVQGRIVLDGTQTARATFRRDGGADEMFVVDLVTGAITPQ
ncbi:MAG: hypothetical protein ACREID_08110 [Planctomycetota bacterium]